MCESVNNIIIETTRQVTDPENYTNLLSIENSQTDSSKESAFSLYYGRYQNAATKIKVSLQHVEDKVEKHNQYVGKCRSTFMLTYVFCSYKNTMYDCQKTYFTQRAPIISTAVSKALAELKEQHKNDYSVLFRSSCLFVMKVCQDECMCFHYFFSRPSEQLSDYLAALCQHLYDSLRPTLITINHLEVLTELCGILRKEMLSDQVYGNDTLEKYVDTVRQMLEDVEERLVFRTNVFLVHDLSAYKPSPGDLAYPEKLEQMEVCFLVNTHLIFVWFVIYI